MTGKRVKRRWRICWKFISPLIILGVIIGGLVQMIRDMADGKYTYTAWDRNKVISLKKLIIELRVLCILSAGVNTICLPVFKRLQEAAKYKAIIFPPHVRSSSPQHPHRCSQGLPHFSCMERDNMKQLSSTLCCSQNRKTTRNRTSFQCNCFLFSFKESFS